MPTRTALITGTSTGIGEACVSASRLTGGGSTPGSDGRRMANGSSRPTRATSSPCPRRHGSVDDRSRRERITGEHGSLDGVVNNAGVGIGGPIELIEMNEWRTQMDINLFGLVAVTRATFPLVDKANGRFVHIGSIAGRIASPGSRAVRGEQARRGSVQLVVAGRTPADRSHELLGGRTGGDQDRDLGQGRAADGRLSTPSSPMPARSTATSG